MPRLTARKQSHSSMLSEMEAVTVKPFIKTFSLHLMVLRVFVRGRAICFRPYNCSTKPHVKQPWRLARARTVQEVLMPLRMRSAHMSCVPGMRSVWVHSALVYCATTGSCQC